MTEPRSAKKGSVEVAALPPYRYTAICWRDDCPGALDTYGGEEVIEIVREHVRDYGCTVKIEAKSIIDVRPASEAGE